MLAALAEILDAGYVALPLGRDLENNRIYVWPYFAEVPLQKLTPAQQVELLRLVPPAAAKEMLQTGKYTYWRLAIGADGTWHHFPQVILMQLDDSVREICETKSLPPRSCLQ